MELAHRARADASFDGDSAELGFSVRSGDVGRETFGLPSLSLVMPIEHLTSAKEDRAFEVQMLLADRGQHRAPSLPELLGILR